MFQAILLGIVVLVAVVCFAFGIIVVQQQTCRVVERFGRYKEILMPGLHFIVPFVDVASKPISMRIIQLNLVIETKTQDNVFVTLTVAVQYCVDPDKVKEAHYKLEYPEEQISAYVFDIVRAEAPNKELDALFVSKDEISRNVQQALQQTMNDYGFIIKQSLVTDIKPDSRVVKAMNSINAAKREQEAAGYEGEANRIKLVAAANAEAESKKLQGEGTANQRKAIAQGIADSVKILRDAGVSEQEANAILLATQYFDMQMAVGAASTTNTILTPLTPVGGSDVLQQLIVALKAASGEKNPQEKENPQRSQGGHIDWPPLKN